MATDEIRTSPIGPAACNCASFADHRTFETKVLRIERANANHSGLYECRAVSQAAGAEPQHGAEREQLRKLLRLTVNGKY